MACAFTFDGMILLAAALSIGRGNRIARKENFRS